MIIKSKLSGKKNHVLILTYWASIRTQKGWGVVCQLGIDKSHQLGSLDVKFWLRKCHLPLSEEVGWKFFFAVHRLARRIHFEFYTSLIYIGLNHYTCYRKRRTQWKENSHCGIIKLNQKSILAKLLLGSLDRHLQTTSTTFVNEIRGGIHVDRSCPFLALIRIFSAQILLNVWGRETVMYSDDLFFLQVN